MPAHWVLASAARTPSLVEREYCLLEAATHAGLSVISVEAEATSYRAGLGAAKRVFARSEQPDGVFSVTDLLALGFMDGARSEFGLRIPEDLCVIGFDNIEQASCEAYRLTTFEQPLEEIANHVVAFLTNLEILAEPPERDGAVFEPVAVWRRSVRPHSG